MEENINLEVKEQADNVGRFERVVTLQPNTFRHLDLFSGIGGFAFAAKSIFKEQYQNIGFCEIDEFAQKVLRKNFGKDITIYNDIKKLKGNEFGTVDIITGGFPCQPFSVAGKQKGKEDERYLWDEMLRVIRTSKPRWIIGENVSGLVQLGLDEILTSLAVIGYTTEQFIIPASAVGAIHRRDRVWIVAYPKSNTFQNENTCEQRFTEIQSQRFNGDREPKRAICGVDDGIPNWVDRIRGLGNAIVPQVAMVLLAAIKTVEDAQCQDVRLSK